ncbi:PTS glucitol/sorbitol transporter subunit IIA [Streptococcus cuniculi]|uniref:PTS sorbitol transporter subunit IIA n=1 Tax=Streptococcus cuniculi TaxID=1432788 RepID=A0A4Y9JB36_9STRE|nr:PTS glucitol/sorbitol transporter subunit IIA [Streptococcus cuniculi]MBF0777928.1 PTS glucitol/sorbitol transporter subunit IIA [Streptococcus cuniculi]TFU98223.1 PTS sorbitol transporter subunit IIA [Streptococcus cuniculi]
MEEFKVVEIGEMVPAFEEEMLIVLFGEQAPPELRAICVVHDYQASKDDVLQVGTKIRMGGQEYTLTKVGGAANANFAELGHVSIYFRQGENDILPGAVIAEPMIFPKLAPGDTINIMNN